MDQHRNSQPTQQVNHAEALFFASIKALKDILDDPDVTEVAINGDEPFLFTSGKGGRKKHDIHINQHMVLGAIKTLARYNDKDANNKAEAIVSQKIGDFRVTGVLSPVSYKGHVLRIRKHTMSDMSLDDMVLAGNITRDQQAILIDIVESGANYLVSGSTAAGKTTVLNAMLAHIPPFESVITIENGVELKIKCIDNTRLLEYPEYGIGGDTLLQTCLRLTPDRIIVGEIRKPIEAATFLEVMGAGHDGCASTIHANSAEKTLMRFESLVSSHVNDSLLSIRIRIASVMNYVVHFHKDKRTHKRSLSGIVKIADVSSNGEYVLERIV